MKNNFFRGHKVTYRKGYPVIYNPQHHRANKAGLVDIHIIVAEEKIGRQLHADEVIHHIDENKENYNSANLLVFDNTASHTTYHNCLKHNISFTMTCINNSWHCESTIEKRDVLKPGTWVCPICGGPMKTKYSKMCLLCKSKLAAKNIPSKKTLVKDLQSFSSFCEIARKYGVSDNAVRKWCKKYNLPYHSSDYKNK